MRFKNIRAFEFIALMSFTMSLVAVSIDAVLPALPAIALELGFITLQHSQMVVSLFVLGMVFGELLFGPLCDANGRRPDVPACANGLGSGVSGRREKEGYAYPRRRRISVPSHCGLPD